MPTNEFGKYLRSKRVAADMGLRDVAAALGIKSHVYLGEVERGVRKPLPQKHWQKLIEAIPGISMAGLERAAAATAPLQLFLEDASPQYQNLALALARRIKEQDLPEQNIRKILKILQGDDDD